jgi:glycosyltransferase involved in cell wall biosynthesis
MISNSALISVGESAKALANMENGSVPMGELALLRRDTFTRVFTMHDTGHNPASMAAGLAFAFEAYRATAQLENIYLGEEFPGIQYLAVHALLRRKKRIAMLIHNVASLKRRLPLATLRLGQLVDHLLCLSAASKAELVARYGYPAARITVVGSRVDTAYFTPDPAAVQKRQICAAGAINRDYDLLIAATRGLDVPLKIAADTAWRYSAGNTQRSTGLPPHVEMRSWGSYVNLRALYAESAVVAVPLAAPMLSGVTVALEGMAMGKPVILSHSRYVEDFLRDGETGYFVPPGDAQALRDKLAYVLSHPAEAAAVGARAREFVAQHFSVAAYVSRILSVWN